MSQLNDTNNSNDGQLPAFSVYPVIGQSAKRGQVAAEFMLYTSIFMLVAIAAFIVVSDLQTSEVPLQQNKVAKEIGQGFVTSFDLSVQGGQGFSYNYAFPRTIFGIPYKIDMRALKQQKPSLIIEWTGSYGEFAYQYPLPPYKYEVKGVGQCLSDEILQSDKCSNTLMLNNVGDKLIITQNP